MRSRDTRAPNRSPLRLSILHFISFAGGFLIILTIALSLFTFTSAAGA